MPYFNRTSLDDLQLIQHIGAGGFSAVFQAKWKGQDVAAKRLNEADPHEAEVLSKLDHPHIINLIGISDDSLDQYVVLELCKEGSLRSYLDQQRSQKKRLPIELVYDWAKQAAKPIQYLKKMEYIHKDVKSRTT
ncbi:protein-tyrosine kinase 6-like [Amphiura filiformis]|uniref:protein-tyrosine kinase 6-like n=1 Tax=Amphiura filiformis TaxID=82378 RepID=UPI003B21959E